MLESISMFYYKFRGQYILERFLSKEDINSAKEYEGGLLVKELNYDLYGEEFLEDVLYFSSFEKARNYLIKQNQKTIADLRRNNDYLSNCNSWEDFQKNLNKDYANL